MLVWVACQHLLASYPVKLVNRVSCLVDITLGARMTQSLRCTPRPIPSVKVSRIWTGMAVFLLALTSIACAAKQDPNVLGPDGRLQTSIEIPLALSTTVATQRVLNAAVRGGFQVESTSQGVVTLAPKGLNDGPPSSKWSLMPQSGPRWQVMLRANIIGSDSASTVVVSGNFTDKVLGGRYAPGTRGAPIGHWVGVKLETVWNEVETFATAIRNER